MKIKVGKLDKRHKGHTRFKYYASFRSTNLLDFVKVRNWCWQTWGPSAELDIQGLSNQKWAWTHNDYNTRIYLISDTEYQWFVLKWK
jgi:hypothetical protein